MRHSKMILDKTVYAGQYLLDIADLTAEDGERHGLTG